MYRKGGAPFWLKLRAAEQVAAPAGATPVLMVRKGRHFNVEVYLRAPNGELSPTGVSGTAGGISEMPTALSLAATRPTFRGAHDAVFVLPASLAPGQTLYARVDARGTGSEELQFSTGTLAEILSFGADHTRMITLAFGALMAMALTSHAWNVPAAISGAAACLFVREIADLRRFWPRVYTAFGWLAVAFIVLAFANIGRHFGLGGVVAAKRSGRNRVQMAEALAA